jgi:hypothetical protein
MERPCLSTCHNKHFVSETLMEVYTVGVYHKIRGNNLIIINISSVQSVLYLKLKLDFFQFFLKGCSLFKQVAVCNIKYKSH